MMTHKPNGGACPVTGKPTMDDHVFAGLGSDAKAKSILNKLLAGEISVNDLERHPDVADPTAFKLALQKARIDAEKRPEFRVQRPLPYFR